jgi:hypothetical protein
MKEEDREGSRGRKKRNEEQKRKNVCTLIILDS